MKGKTTIELTDAKTGAKEVIESENMVTNALSYFFANLGMINKTPFYDSAMTTGEAIFKLLGGILLFDRAITEDADNIHTPAGVRMTGNAAYGYTSNNEVLEFGSYNASESGWQADGSLKFVYDFTTSQANGDIACVCLTSLEHGYIGEGNKSCEYYTGTHDDYCYQGLNIDVWVDGDMINGTYYPRIINIDYDESTITVLDYKNLYYNRSYSDEFFGNTGKLKVRKYRIPLSKYDLRDNVNSHVLIEEREIELPEDFITFVNASSPASTRTNILQLTDAIYLVFEQEVSYVDIGGEIRVLKINPDYSTEQYSVINQTGERLMPITFSSGYGFVLSDKLVYRAYSDSKKCYCINIKNSADFSEIANVAGLELTNIARNKMRTVTEDRVQSTNYIMDLKNHEILPINTSSPNVRGCFTGIISGNPLASIYDNSSSSSGYTFSVLRSQNYLATINNLENKVTKTSDKTMKVTYTVTF